MLLYNLFTRLYYLLIALASPFNPKAKLWINGRKNLIKHIRISLKNGEERIWIHCSSLGEFEQGRPIIERLKIAYPNHKIVLTFFSPSGYEIRKNYKEADYVFYLPADTPRNAKAFISMVKPSFVIFVKYEFWMHYINQLEAHNIPLYLVSAIFRKEQLFFKWYGSFYHKILHKISWFFVQNEESNALLFSIGLTNNIVSGDTRFDRVAAIAEAAKDIPYLDSFCNDSFVIVAGSTYKTDIEIIASFLKGINDTNIKFIIAPHEINEVELQEIINSFPKNTVRYSLVNKDTIKDAQVLIIDSIGMLAQLYRYGSIAYVGGGFGKGIHNILEAATFGMPVIFGPNFNRFNEAKELVRLGCGISVSPDEFNSVIMELYANEMKRKDLALISENYVKQNEGATDKIMTKIFALHPQKSKI